MKRPYRCLNQQFAAHFLVELNRVGNECSLRDQEWADKDLCLENPNSRYHNSFLTRPDSRFLPPLDSQNQSIHFRAYLPQ